jgi:hypothetical protein
MGRQRYKHHSPDTEHCLPGQYGVLHGKGIREEESVMRKILGAENGQELEKRLAFGEKKIREKF